MGNHQPVDPPIQNRTRPAGTGPAIFWWLGPAALLLPFANGRNTVPAAAWLAPVFLLRMVRTQPAGRGLLIAWVALSGAWAFQFRGMAPLPGIFYYALAAVYGLVGVLPFVADRILVPRLRGFSGTLIFPCAWVGTEFLVARFTPYGSWGSAAYTQHESLVLMQMLSLTGLFGISFLIAWFASVCNWAGENRFEWQAIRRGVLAFALVMSAVLILAGARLNLFPPGDSSVRVASLTRPDIDLFPDADFARRAMAGQLNEDEVQELRRRGDLINDDLLKRAEREVLEGAKIVFWGESNSFVFKQDEPELIRRGADLARKRQIYLGIGVGTWNPAGTKPLENKLLLIDPRGDVSLDMWKARPVPGPEAAVSARDDGRIKSVATPHGEVGAAICFDMDFPDLLAQAGRLGVDLMLVPSNDWREIDPWHTHMARYRAVEQGFNMVRHASGGLSLAADYQGRVLNSMDHYTTADRVLISHVPTRGVRTVYSIVGDLFAWSCLGCLAAFLAAAWKKPVFS